MKITKRTQFQKIDLPANTGETHSSVSNLDEKRTHFSQNRHTNFAFFILHSSFPTRYDSTLFQPLPPGGYRRILLEAVGCVPHIHNCQGPRNVDLRTPPGPEGSNGSLLDICRGHPGTFQ